MAEERSAQVVLEVRGGAAATRDRVERFFLERGWSPRERAGGRVDYERGSLRRTIVLGALAGRRFFLTAQIEVRAREGGTDIRYRWGDGAGLALGGRLGRQRAARAHEETAAELRRELFVEGVLLHVHRD